MKCGILFRSVAIKDSTKRRQLKSLCFSHCREQSLGAAYIHFLRLVHVHFRAGGILHNGAKDIRYEGVESLGGNG